MSQNAFAAFRHRDFSVFWVAAVLSNSGTWMQLITVPYVVDQYTHSTALVGLSAFVSQFPTALLAPLSGSLADQFPRRTVMLWTQGGTAVATLAIWILWLTGSMTTLSLLILVGIAACGQGLTMSTWQAFVTQLVPNDVMLEAVRLNQAQFVASRAIGPAIAGPVLAAYGPGPAFLLNAISFVIVVLALLTIKPQPATGKPDRAILRHFIESIEHVRRHSVLALAVLLGINFMLFGNAIMQLAEPFSRNVLHVGPTAFGLLFACYGFGSLSMLPYILLRGSTAKRSALVIGGFGAFSVAEIGLGIAPDYALAVVAVFVMGAANTLLQMALQTSLQFHVDDAHRGRVMSMYIVASYGGVPVGALAGGLVAGAVGLRPTFIGAAVLLGGLAALVAIRGGGVRQLDSAGAMEQEHGVATAE